MAVSHRPSAATSSWSSDGSAVVSFFDTLELVPPYPGAKPEVTYAGVWGAEDPELADSDGSRWLYCGVARKP